MTLSVGVLTALVAVVTGLVQGAVFAFAIGKWAGKVNGRFDVIEVRLNTHDRELDYLIPPPARARRP